MVNQFHGLQSLNYLTFTAAIPLTLTISAYKLSLTLFTSLTFGQFILMRFIIFNRWSTNQFAIRILFFINHQTITIIGFVILLKAKRKHIQSDSIANALISNRWLLTKLNRTLFFGKNLLISR